MSNPTQSGGLEIQTREKQALEHERTRSGWTFRPDVDVVEHADEVVVTADLPGVDEGHVRVELENGVLSIDADPAFQPEAGWRLLHEEYRVGGYHREFHLTDRVDPTRISASMRDGVLEVRLPKQDEHRPRTIPVRGA